MISLYEEVKKHVIISLRDKHGASTEQIKQHITAVLQMQRSLGRNDEVNEDGLFRDIQAHVNTWQAEASVLRDPKHIRWVTDRKLTIQWDFWKRYRQYLEEEKGRSSIVTARLDKITDDILSDIGNPAQSGQWDRRGMVVGEVQSGKTANYTGLICKAVDAGYKLIIVLAGMTNDLRSQTQARLDAEFLGFESEVGKLHNNGSRIGVGLIDAPGQLIAHPLTYSSKDGDFLANKATNLQLGGSPLLLVVKKNAAVLKRILTWVESQGKIHPATGKRILDGVPLLLLDDEADNASVNTKKEDEDPTQINKAIRLILNAFQQRSYVGYTATPFANIFILPDTEDKSKYGDDLFPRGFIYSITPPTNYIGPAQLFGLSEDLEGGNEIKEGLPLTRSAIDAEVVFPQAHKKDLQVNNLPETLICAIQSFVISCAARRVRGQKDVDNSMLIHVTRFNMVQRQVMELVSNELVNMFRTIEYNTGMQAVKLFEDLENLWIEDYLPTINAVGKENNDPQLIPIEWEDVRNELLNAISKIEVRGINGDVGGALDYANHPNGLNVIAVGGDKLSRGLTLEGLSVSYYIRPSKNYDTLLQMGRWFGYRPGYADLCRLYSTDDIIGWYEHIAVANEELRREFNFMELSRRTPEDYGLKVRTHPAGLSVTAANKIRHGNRMRVSFSGHLSQTTIFQKINNVYQNNFNITESWIKSLSEPARRENKGVTWTNVAAAQIIKFLENYSSHPLSRQTESDLLIKYIRKLYAQGELVNWTVGLISNSTKREVDKVDIGGYRVGLLQRTDDTPNDKDLYMLKRSNILSPGDEMLDLTEEQSRIALEANIAAWKAGEARGKNEPKRPSGPFIRNIREPQNALLLLYPLENPLQNEEPSVETPVIGFAISFPKSNLGEASAIEYQVNTKYWRDRYGEEDEDEA
ncbi:Z1 domain-containing protein [Dyadobacter sp. Leaf189]|uniref:Z1 domain-containing protein n=1 Tax=Dyadobacter sp. Leaf189 TaxID=1736295 RepID=UPI00070093B2|nr:Z1 domain-containing protein [Dyadobacter sp. Leaf189]KQS32740.1 hypothetical protein ASG33_01095 [Dyadobacter sp. Leaf189]